MKKYHKIKRLSGLILSFSIICSSAYGVPQAIAENHVDSLVSRTEPVASNQKTISGRILDAATNTPILGARVQSADQQFSAMTDETGRFTINLPQYLNQLHINAIDYISIDVPIRGQDQLTVQLFRSGNQHVTPALSIDSEIQTQLGSEVRTITRSGTPAIGSSMFIRGYNSLNIGSQPLIIVDGVIFDNQYDRASIHDGFILNPLSTISVDDVESVEVMKNGTSLYGSKGGNGILVIKTKRGKDPVTKITASALLGVNERPKDIPLLDASQFRVYASDLLKDVFQDPSQISSLPFLNDDPNYFDYMRYHNNNDWYKDVSRNSITQSYNIGVSGGDNVALYNLSVGYTDAASTLKENDFSRFNARFNTDIDLTSKFNFSFDISYSQTDRNLRNDGFAEESDLITSPSVLSLLKAPFLIPYEYANTGRITSDLSGADDFNLSNPVAIMKKGVGESSQTYFNLMVRPNYEFSKSLTLSGTFNYSLNSLFEKYFRPMEGTTIIQSPDGVELKNHVKAQNTKQNSIWADLHLDWKKRFDIHFVNVTGGARFLSDTYSGSYGSGYNTSSDLDHNLNGSLTDRVTTGYDDSWRSFSWYINADYSLLNKYLLSFTASADASSRFGKEADTSMKIAGLNWAIFPEVNAAWLISSEDFMQGVPFINRMKLRAGYGTSGNDNIPIGAAITYFGTVRYINQYSGKKLLNIGNDKLKMETVSKTNIGLDLGFLNDRITLSADYFHHVTSDLLTMKRHKYITGKDYYWVNDGKLQNSGFELALNVKALTLPDFQWEVGGSIMKYKNKIKSLPDGDYTTSIYGGEVLTAVGHPAGLFYGYKTQGVFATTAEANEAGLKVKDYTGTGYIPFGAGDMHFVDLHNDGIIDEKDKTIIGDPNPDFTGTFNMKFTYKKLSLNAFFTYSYGNDVYNYVRSQLEAGNNLYNQSSAMLNRWVSEGQRTSIPKISYLDRVNNSRFSDRWIEDGSYLRLKTLTLSYEVPTNWMFLSGFTVWASANNLWTWTKYLGPDPEFSIQNSILYQGIDSGLLSQGRSYFVGLKLNL